VVKTKPRNKEEREKNGTLFRYWNYKLICELDELKMIQNFKELFKDAISGFDLRELQPKVETDIPRLQLGEVGAQFWSVYVSCKTAEKDAVRASLEQTDVTRRMINLYPDVFMLALTSTDIEQAFALGKIASVRNGRRS